MACGENPKRIYGGRQQMPSSRLGSAWLMRKKFEEARDLIARQDEFDCKSQPVYATRPDSLQLLPLTYLLRRHPNITLHIHCYETQDIEMLFRLSDEFGFKIDTLQHALEAYKIADRIKKRNITVATFSDMFGFKTEAFESSVQGPRLLEQAGVNVVLKSDHPVTNSHWLLMSAGKAHYYGMTARGALDAVTINPAQALKLPRVGALKPGYDADIVLFDRHPLLFGARADKVFVDGRMLVDKQLPLKNDRTTLYSPNTPVTVTKGVGTECKTRNQYSSYAIENAKIYTMNGPLIANGRVIVQNGNVTCVGACTIPADAIVFSAKSSIVTPGLIESVTDLGLVEISSETLTYDGSNASPLNFNLRARDAIRMESRTMQAAFRGGVTTAISHRQGNSIVNGQSVAFHTIGPFISDSVIQDSIAVQINIGTGVKATGDAASISGQVAALRKWLTSLTNKTAIENGILSGTVPLVVKSHQADDIDQLLTLQNEFGFSLIIMGGAETHLLVDKIRGRKVSVVLTPISEDESWYQSWDTRRSGFDYGSTTLYKSGINFGIGTGNSAHEVRNLRWMAGLLSTEGIGEIVYEAALASVTSKIADMYSLPNGVGRIVAGTRANLILFDGNPLTFEGRPKLVAVGDTLECGDQLEQF
jgi:imidazolonepropionase-like amidohydrolase